MLGAMRRDLRVQFIHGLESSPQGVKAQLFARHFDARTPEMDTHDFAASVAVQAAALRAFDPHVLVEPWEQVADAARDWFCRTSAG